jgi:lipopolysaccharide heptosyltransferase II
MLINKKQNDLSKNEYKKILVFQTAFLGDLVLSIPLIEGIHRVWPNALIDVIVKKGNESLLNDHPLINEVISYDKRGKARGLKGLAGIIRTVKSKSYDLVISPHRSFRTALINFISGIKTRVGYKDHPGTRLYTKRVFRDIDLHEVARNMSLLENLELTAELSRPELPKIEKYVQESSDWIDNNLPGKNHIITIAPGSVWATKRWPQEHWITLVGMLIDNSQSKIVIIGGPEDNALAEIIADSHPENVFSAAGKMSIYGSAELIRQSSLIISGDTAPLHLGVAVDTPVLAIFGPTVPEFGFGPTGDSDRIVGLNIDCRPCAIHGTKRCPLQHHDCMKKLSPQMVFDVALSMLTEDKAN